MELKNPIHDSPEIWTPRSYHIIHIFQVLSNTNNTFFVVEKMTEVLVSPGAIVLSMQQRPLCWSYLEQIGHQPGIVVNPP